MARRHDGAGDPTSTDSRVVTTIAACPIEPAEKHGRVFRVS